MPPIRAARRPSCPGSQGAAARCPQLPTTLPTLDELLGIDGLTAANVHERLLQMTRAPQALQVFTLHAELEGMKLLPVLERLLAGWQAQGYALVSLRQALESLDLERLPVAVIEAGSVPGRSGTLALQSAAPAAADFFYNAPLAGTQPARQGSGGTTK